MGPQGRNGGKRMGLSMPARRDDDPLDPECHPGKRAKNGRLTDQVAATRIMKIEAAEGRLLLTGRSGPRLAEAGRAPSPRHSTRVAGGGPVPDGRPYISICREAAVDEATSSSTWASRRHHPGSRPPAARRFGICPMPGRAASTPSPHRSTNSIKASLGNAERRPPFAHDARQAYAGGHQACSLTLAKRPMAGNHCVAATPDHPSFPSARASQAVLCNSRRRVEALDLLSLDLPEAPTHRWIGGANSHGLAA
jgi:hypothetical protein